MQTRPQAIPAMKQLTPDVRSELLRKLQQLRRNATEMRTSTSIARRSQTHGMVNQLCDRVIALDPPADVARYSHAIFTAFGTHDWDAIIATCERFEAMLEGKTQHYPVETSLATGEAPALEAALADIAAPPPAQVAEPPAIPVAVRDVPAPADPKPEQAKPVEAANDQADTLPANDDAPVIVAGIAAVEKLGEAIRLGRVSKRMTQKEVATAAGVGRRFVVELESGKGKSEIGRIFAVCQVVGVTLTATAA